MGLSDAKDWPGEIETVLTEDLAGTETADAAAYALYCNESAIRQTDTLEAPARDMRSPDGLIATRAIPTLACQTKRSQSTMALQLLNETRITGSGELRVKIAETLGWATDAGLPLLQRTAVDSSSDVGAATAKALGCGYKTSEDGQNLLTKLINDEVNAMRMAATEAMNG